MTSKPFILALFVADTIVAAPTIQAAESNCSQNRIDGTTMPLRRDYITPTQGVIRSPSEFPRQVREAVVPFYQWENDNGYCGEVSMMQAGLNSGQWMSQFNARKICGTGLAQSGSPSYNDSWCSNHKDIPNYNAQLLIEDPGTGVSDNYSAYANAALCLANSRLSATTYPYLNRQPTPPGCQTNGECLGWYKDYMSWVKREVLTGHQVTVGVLFKYGSDPQYDHEVTVIAIGTDNPIAPIYYDNDVLYIDDHGAYTLVGNNQNKGNPAIPYGAGNDATGCTPYIFGYTFGSLPQTRKGANLGSAQAYSIIIPGVYPTNTSTGGDGYLGTKPITGHNYGFSVLGAVDNSRDGVRHLLPIQLSMLGSTTNRVANPEDPVAHWQYENSMIGTDIQGMSCTNSKPQYWMKPLTLRVNVSGLSSGTAYNLYEYDFTPDDNSYPTDRSAALPVPTGDFNSNARMASNVTHFTATESTYSQTVTKASNQIVVFRAVPVSAP